MSIFKWILSLAIFDDFPDPVFCKSVSGRYLYSNRAHREFFGIPETRPPFTVQCGVHADAVCRRSDQEAFERGEPIVNIEFLKERQPGPACPFEVHKIPIRDKDRQWLGLIGVIRAWQPEREKSGVTARIGETTGPGTDFSGLIAALDTESAAARWALVGQNLNRPIYILDGRELLIIACNDAAATLAGRPRETLVGRPFATLFADFDLSSWPDAAWRSRATHRSAQGEERPVVVEFKKIERVAGFWGFAVLDDLTTQNRRESRWREQRLYDWRTGLPGRMLWGERLRVRLGAALAAERVASLLLVEVEHAQTVLDSDGYDHWDRLLQSVAARIRALTSPRDLVGVVRERVFGIYVETPGSRDDLDRFVRCLVAALGNPHVVDGLEISGLTARAGITMLVQDDLTLDAMVNQAGLALREARKTGLAVVHFEDEMSLERETGHRIREAFGQALRACKPFLVYQPIVDMAQGTLFGFEGLIRWREDEHHQRSADEFIGSVESDPALARELGQFVLMAAAGHIEQWTALGFEGALTINIGARHFLSEHFLNDVGEALQRVTRDRDRLIIEITETGPFADLERARVVTETLQSWGVRVLLDDFGTGYASMVHLHQLPVNGIKIDKRFVQNLLQDDKALWIVSSLLLHAQSQGLLVIAEGVENDSVGTLLLELGCHLAQGYYIARPLMAWDIPNWLAKWTPPARWRRRRMRPWPLTNLDGMAAGFSHLRWVEEIRHALVAEGEDAQKLEGHLLAMCDRSSGEQCRLGAWLRHSAPVGSAGRTKALLPRIERLHAGIHAQGLRAVSELQTGDRKRALRHVEEQMTEPTHELLSLLVSALTEEDRLKA
ncbi:sensory box/GGDEF/GAF/EAL domain protein [mine drainage metagenome]|uniref:Sensory box/GGDEF/GAF/EAL domain protein n=2 Tax=mine drainage metagenome TaxID=410659 RepID=T1D3S5_9ZZZZ